jgi:hypothetical protein
MGLSKGQKRPRSTASLTPCDQDRSPEYDFSKGVRGKYAKRSNVILLDPDLMEYFPDSESVNTALRTIVELGKPKTRRTRSPR